VRSCNLQNNNQRSVVFASGYSAVFYRSDYKNLREDSQRVALKSSAIKCAWLVALLYMVIQVYVLYMNTYHIFAGTPPMCQICAALDNFDSAAIGNDNVVSIISQSTIPAILLYNTVNHSFLTYRFPRAPPT